MLYLDSIITESSMMVKEGDNNKLDLRPLMKKSAFQWRFGDDQYTHPLYPDAVITVSASYNDKRQIRISTKNMERMEIDKLYQHLVRDIKVTSRDKWRPQKHHEYPKYFHREVFTFLLINKRYGNILYKDLLYLIIEHISIYVHYDVSKVSKRYIGASDIPKSVKYHLSSHGFNVYRDYILFSTDNFHQSRMKEIQIAQITGMELDNNLYIDDDSSVEF